MPDANIFTGVAGPASFASFGWAALLHPMPVGTHTVRYVVTGDVLAGQGEVILHVVPGA